MLPDSPDMVLYIIIPRLKIVFEKYFAQTHSRCNPTKIKTRVIFLTLTMEEGKQTTLPTEVGALSTLNPHFQTSTSDNCRL